MQDILFEILGKQPFILIYAGAVVFSLIRYPRYFDTPLRFFPVLLMYNLLTEILGTRILNNNEWSIVLTDFYFNINWLVYNIYAIIHILYLLYIFHAYLEHPKIRRALLAGASLYVAASVANVFIQDFVNQSQLYAYTLGGLLLIVFSLSYLRQEFGKREMRGFRLHNLLIWISLGTLIFFSGYTPLKMYRSYMDNDPTAPIEWIRYAHLALIYSMYACLLAGFLLMGRMKKPMSSQKPPAPAENQED